MMEKIRFIKPDYKELFRVPDGGRVRVTRPDGTWTSLLCEYIDDYHARIGGRVFHICEFAELADSNGWKCEAEA